MTALFNVGSTSISLTVPQTSVAIMNGWISPENIPLDASASLKLPLRLQDYKLTHARPYGSNVVYAWLQGPDGSKITVKGPKALKDQISWHDLIQLTAKLATGKTFNLFVR